MKYKGDTWRLDLEYPQRNTFTKCAIGGIFKEAFAVNNGRRSFENIEMHRFVIAHKISLENCACFSDLCQINSCRSIFRANFAWKTPDPARKYNASDFFPSHFPVTIVVIMQVSHPYILQWRDES